MVLIGRPAFPPKKKKKRISACVGSLAHAGQAIN
jgi:hypothetical protein